jgi:hypothetical protein
MEVYALKWSGTGIIPLKECYTDKVRAKKCLALANKNLGWRNKILGHRWLLETLTINEGVNKKDKIIWKSTP